MKTIVLTSVAKRTGLTVPGAQKSIGKLLRSGFISRVDGGRKHQYEIRRSDRLMQIAIELFQSEKNRYERLLSAIKKDSQLKMMYRKLADIIQQDASIVRRAKDHIDSLLIEEQGTAAGDLIEWRNILDTYSIQRLIRFVTSSSERASGCARAIPRVCNAAGGLAAANNVDQRSRIHGWQDRSMCRGARSCRQQDRSL